MCTGASGVSRLHPRHLPPINTMFHLRLSRCLVVINSSSSSVALASRSAHSGAPVCLRAVNLFRASLWLVIPDEVVTLLLGRNPYYPIYICFSARAGWRLAQSPLPYDDAPFFATYIFCICHARKSSMAIGLGASLSFNVAHTWHCNNCTYCHYRACYMNIRVEHSTFIMNVHMKL